MESGIAEGRSGEANRFNQEQIMEILKDDEAGLATADVCRKHGVSSATF